MSKVICGIYKITNKLNGMMYIGQSVNIYHRWLAHQRAKDNQLLHRAIQKYGKENFSWEILIQCSKEKLNQWEQYFVKYYNTFLYDEGSNGYNLTRGGEGGITVPVLQYDLDGNFIRRFESMAEAAGSVGRMVTQISSCCKKMCTSCGGYRWSFEGEKPGEYRPCGLHSRKKVDQYDLLGNYICTFESVTEASIFVSRNHFKSISKGQIANCCRKENASAAGFLWRFHGDVPPQPYKDRYYSIIQQLNDDGDVLNTFTSLEEASNFTGIRKSNISRCLSGTVEHAGGYKWKRIN